MAHTQFSAKIECVGNYIERKIESKIDAILAKGKSILLLGPRQTGKTTMLKQRKCDLYISFIQPRERLRYELDPTILADEILAVTEKMTAKPLVIVDEVQKVPLLKSKTRHKLSKSQKYLIFDLGLRRIAAKEGARLPIKQMEHLFEQFVGLELVRQARFNKERTNIKYWCDLNGPEVDWVIDKPEQLIPIEVKYTNKPSLSDARHLKIFLDEYSEANSAYIICQSPRKMKLANQIYPKRL